ncbi:TPA: hypothetical protein ACX6S8_003808 [Photobacterium damselae]
MDDLMASLENVNRLRKERLAEIEMLKIKDYSSDLDDKFLVRCNSEMKAAFDRLCKENKTDKSTAIRLLVEKSLRNWTL